MDQKTLAELIGLAAFIGCFHTLTGPDHFIPFIAMSKVGGWSLRRTTAVTLACGMGHVLSSILIGTLGIGFGLLLTRLVDFESSRGMLAGWLLLGFGLAYMTWGIFRAIRNRPHAHVHAHPNGTIHGHKHTHHSGHAHVHGKTDQGSMTPWVLFAIFVFGPCEPLIPILMYPAAQLSVSGALLVAAVFAFTTLATMLTMVLAGYFGLAQLSFPRLGRYAHAIAGGSIAMCGAAIQFGL